MLILINVKFKIIEIAVSDNMKGFAFRIIQIQFSSSYLKRFNYKFTFLIKHILNEKLNDRNTYSKFNS